MQPQLTITRLTGEPDCLTVRGEIGIWTPPDLLDGLRSAVQAATPRTPGRLPNRAVVSSPRSRRSSAPEPAAYGSSIIAGSRYVPQPAQITYLLSLVRFLSR